MINGTKGTKSRAIRRKMYACRKRLGFTCAEVADMADICREHYIKIENGVNTPSRAVLQRIAKVLRVEDFEQLYEIEEVTAEDKKEFLKRVS